MIQPVSDNPPEVIDLAADAEFKRVVAMGGTATPRLAQFTLNYVDHEWRHVRNLFTVLGGVRGKRLLEFGCNIGATSIVATTLGATISGVDIDESVVKLARLNASRYGMPGLDFRYVPDTRVLPYEDETFHLVTCNSVLEYVTPDHRLDVLKEMDRVLLPSGLLIIAGTSNRFWPVEAHSRQFGSNYIPASLAPSLRRGVSPWKTRRTLKGFRDVFLEDPGLYVEYKRLEGWPEHRARVAGMVAGVARPFSFSIGMLLPSFVMVLRKEKCSPIQRLKIPQGA